MVKTNNSNILNLDLYEKVIALNCIKSGNEEYLSSVIDHIDPELFKDRNVANLIGLIREFYIENNAIPNRTEIKSKIVNQTLLDSFKKLLEEFKSLDKNYSQSELIKNTETFVKQRLLLRSVESSLDEYTTTKEFDEVRIISEIDKIQSISLLDNLGMDFFGDSSEFIKKLEERESFISTGYSWLDSMFGGGLYKEGKAMYAFAGETNTGKSIVLGNIASNVFMENYDVVVISLEMSEFRYAKRIASMLSGIPQIELSNRTDDYMEFVNSHDKSNRLFIKEFPTKQITAKHVAGYLKGLERKKNFNPSLIVLDYHTLLRPSVPQGSKHADLQYITQESRALTYLWNCPLISAAQLNRPEGETSSPGLERVAGSWDMLSDLDYHVSIWQTDEDREANILRAESKKGRDSTRNVHNYWIVDYNTLRLKEEGNVDAYSLETESIMANMFDE